MSTCSLKIKKVRTYFFQSSLSFLTIETKCPKIASWKCPRIYVTPKPWCSIVIQVLHDPRVAVGHQHIHPEEIGTMKCLMGKKKNGSGGGVSPWWCKDSGLVFGCLRHSSDRKAAQSQVQLVSTKKAWHNDTVTGKKSPRNARETMLAHQTHQTHKNTKQKPSPMNGLIQSWSKSWGSRMKLGPPWRKRINRWSVETSQPTCGNSQPSRLPSICHAKQTKHPNQKAHWLQQITMSLLLHIMCNYKPLLATFGGTWRHTCSNLWPKSKRFKKSASRGALMLLASASAPSAQRLLNIAEKKLDAFRDASRDAFRFSPPCEVRSHETGLDQQRHKTCIDQPWIRSKQQKDAFGTDHWSRYY